MTHWQLSEGGSESIMIAVMNPSDTDVSLYKDTQVATIGSYNIIYRVICVVLMDSIYVRVHYDSAMIPPSAATRQGQPKSMLTYMSCQWLLKYQLPR